MTNLKVAFDNLKDVLECKTHVEALKDEINNLSKILDAVKPDGANEVAEILNDGEIAKEIERVYHIVYELVGDLSEGAIKGVTRCAACEKVLVEGHDEIREWTGSSLCEYCYDEFSRQAEEEIGIDDEYVPPTERELNTWHASLNFKEMKKVSGYDDEEISQMGLDDEGFIEREHDHWVDDLTYDEKLEIYEWYWDVDAEDEERAQRLTALIAMQSEAKEDKVDGISLFSGWFDSLSDNARSKAYSEIYSQAALYESIE